MLSGTGNKQKNRKPQAKDENVREEIQQEEDLNSIQPNDAWLEEVKC